MADTSVYPVLSRIRRDGEVYAPDTERDEIELDEKEAARLQKLGCIGAAVGGERDSDFDLKAALVDLITEGKDVKSMNMADLGKLLGKNARGVKRDDVNKALAAIEKETAT